VLCIRGLAREHATQGRLRSMGGVSSKCPTSLGTVGRVSGCALLLQSKGSREGGSAME